MRKKPLHDENENKNKTTKISLNLDIWFTGVFLDVHWEYVIFMKISHSARTDSFEKYGLNTK